MPLLADRETDSNSRPRTPAGGSPGRACPNTVRRLCWTYFRTRPARFESDLITTTLGPAEQYKRFSSRAAKATLDAASPSKHRQMHITTRADPRCRRSQSRTVLSSAPLAMRHLVACALQRKSDHESSGSTVQGEGENEKAYRSCPDDPGVTRGVVNGDGDSACHQAR